MMFTAQDARTIRDVYPRPAEQRPCYPLPGRRCSAVGGTSWHVDETCLKVRGRWCYLYRAIDRDGNLIDAMASETRAMKAARTFFRSARATMGFRPERVTADGHGSYPRAIRSVLGRPASTSSPSSDTCSSTPGSRGLSSVAGLRDDGRIA